MSTLREELRETPTELLLWRLPTPDPVMQRRIAFELGRRQATEAVGYLRCLLDETGDPRTRAAAAEALGEIGDDGAGEALIAAFCDETQPAEVRDTCAYALARLRYEPALERLFKGLVDPAPSVKRCALAAIVAIGGEAARERIAFQAELEQDEALKTEMQAIRPAQPSYHVSFGGWPVDASQLKLNAPMGPSLLQGLLFSSRAEAQAA